jgi:hypothetical protein
MQREYMQRPAHKAELVDYSRGKIPICSCLELQKLRATFPTAIIRNTIERLGISSNIV